MSKRYQSSSNLNSDKEINIEKYNYTNLAYSLYNLSIQDSFSEHYDKSRNLYNEEEFGHYLAGLL